MNKTKKQQKMKRAKKTLADERRRGVFYARVVTRRDDHGRAKQWLDMRDPNRDSLILRLSEFDAGDVEVAGEWVVGYSSVPDFFLSFLVPRRKRQFSAVLVPFVGLEHSEDR